VLKKSGSSRRRAKGLSVYSNLASKRRSKRDARARRKAEYLASLPKHPVKRFLHRLHPRRFFAYWFSRDGALMALKIAGVSALIMFVFAGALFAYYRRELDAIRPAELSKRVQTTVTRYYDRNDKLLWEDRGDGDYKLVIESDEISQYMKDATVAIEDRDFFKHSGVSPTGIVRSAVNNLRGGDVQGGSTLTVQLVKQVFISEEEQQLRGLNGVPRKIKEAILALEVERMYNKDQILTLYLNESPYGGRRNGVESAAQAYFAKHAKDLDLAEAALLAGIPQLPGYYDPYNPEGHESLIARQHAVLDAMARDGYITRDEANDAKKIAILDKVKPERGAYSSIKAPHFVQTVQQELIEQLGRATVGRGGLNVKTTLDLRVQNTVERALRDLFRSDLPASGGFDNGAATVVDVPTGQVLAMQGSRNFNYPGYGSFNAATSFIQPGSSIKPLVFAGLFKGNFGAGTILRDEPINNIYGAELRNFDNRFRGDISIRSGLAESRNIPAVKAMHIAGRDETLETIHEMGDHSYCTDGADQEVGLAASIGGCGLKQVEHTNAFATLARMGEYKPVSYILEVTNTQGQKLDLNNQEDEAKEAVDPQIAYIINDILGDDGARAPSFGSNSTGFSVPGVRTAAKTGTSNIEDDSKDLWMMSYSPRVSLGLWVGNHDSTPMNHALSSLLGPTVNAIMEPIHKNVFEKDGSWKPNDWFKRPDGIKNVTTRGRSDVFPSWYNAPRSTGEKMEFDRVSKRRATDCTPERAIIEIGIEEYTDPVTNRKIRSAPDGYDPNKKDNIHKCNDVKPFVGNISYSGNRISVDVTRGTHALQSVEFRVDGKKVGSVSANSTRTYNLNYKHDDDDKEFKVEVLVIDKVYYHATGSHTVGGGG
jgi:membrane peptidoglycan carboxypeptidase